MKLLIIAIYVLIVCEWMFGRIVIKNSEMKIESKNLYYRIVGVIKIIVGMLGSTAFTYLLKNKGIMTEVVFRFGFWGLVLLMISGAFYVKCFPFDKE